MPLSRQNRRKWLGYATALFATGALSGAVFGWGEAYRRRPFFRPMGPPSGQHLCDHLRDGLEFEFGIDREKLSKIEPILQRRAQGVDRILERSRTELDALTRASDDELATALGLSAEQKARLPMLGRGGPRERGGDRHEWEERGDRRERDRYPGDRRPPPPPR